MNRFIKKKIDLKQIFQENKWVIFLVLAKLGFVFFVIFFSYLFFDFNQGTYAVNFIYPEKEPVSLKSAFSAWDAKWYFFIAENGYGNAMSSAFYPLYPAAIKLLNFIAKNSFLSGLLLSNLFTLVGSCFLFKILKNDFNETVAKESLILLLLFPTSFFFSLPYSES
ncbi:hypothetical protein C4572_03275 [Candidatus Parcubacteria bacterium]|nr:MAG: hypothetical protein C4572_03275 [Candidatus Parcubacteria bacterium]